MRYEEQISITNDLFVYTLACFTRGFPREDEMTRERAIAELFDGVQYCYLNAKNKTAKEWLDFALENMRQAKEAFDEQNIPQVEKYLESARENLERREPRRK